VRSLGDQAITVEAMLQSSSDSSSDRQTNRKRLDYYAHNLVIQLSALTSQSNHNTEVTRYDEWKKNGDPESIIVPASDQADNDFKAHEIKAFIYNLVTITTNHPAFKDQIDSAARTQIEAKIQTVFGAIDSMKFPNKGRFHWGHTDFVVPLTADASIEFSLELTAKGYKLTHSSFILAMSETEKARFTKRLAGEQRAGRIEAATRSISAIDMSEQIAKKARHGRTTIDLGSRGNPITREEANQILVDIGRKGAYLTVVKTESNEVRLEHKETQSQIVFTEQQNEATDEKTFICEIVFTSEQTRKHEAKYAQILNDVSQEFSKYLMSTATIDNPLVVENVASIVANFKQRRSNDFSIPDYIDPADLRSETEKILRRMRPNNLAEWVSNQSSLNGLDESKIFPITGGVWRAKLSFDANGALDTQRYSSGYKIEYWSTSSKN
jgi:hypothetical protein